MATWKAKLRSYIIFLLHLVVSYYCLNCFKFHALQFLDELLIASGSNGKTVSIYDVKLALNKDVESGNLIFMSFFSYMYCIWYFSLIDSSKSNTVIEINDAFRSFDGHTARITGLSWKHDNSQVVSSSYDGTAQV